MVGNINPTSVKCARWRKEKWPVGVSFRGRVRPARLYERSLVSPSIGVGDNRRNYAPPARYSGISGPEIVGYDARSGSVRVDKQHAKRTNKYRTRVISSFVCPRVSSFTCESKLA